MKSRIKRHILALLLFPLLLGACAPQPSQTDNVKGLASVNDAEYLGGYVYRVVDGTNGVTCYSNSTGGLRCFTQAELDQK